MAVENREVTLNISTFLTEIILSHKLYQSSNVPDCINWQDELNKFNSKHKVTLTREELLDEANNATLTWEDNPKNKRENPLYKQQIDIAWSIYTQLWPETTQIQ